MLFVNFRGSTGFGQAALESLAGTAGRQDVRDVVLATQSAIKEGMIDPDRVGVCGGSHGKSSASLLFDRLVNRRTHAFFHAFVQVDFLLGI